MTARRSLRSIVALVTASIVGLMVAPGLAHAHTEFDYSLPADGASVGVPVDEITVAFTSPVSLVGNGFAVLDPQNNELVPVAVTDDDTVFRLQLDPPLVGGTVGVKYEVRAEDGHVLSGNVVFVVDAPAPTTAPSTTPDTTPVPTPATTASPAPRSPVPTSATSQASATAPETATQATATSEPPVTDDVTTPTTPEIPSTGSETDDDSGPGVGLVIALAAAAAALAVGGGLLVRSRTGT